MAKHRWSKVAIGFTLLAALIVGASIALAGPAWKEVTYTRIEVDVPLDYNSDGVVDNLYTTVTGSDGSIVVDYYLPGEQWGVVMTIVGTESYTLEGKGKNAEWKVIDMFDPWTHLLIQEKQ